MPADEPLEIAVLRLKRAFAATIYDTAYKLVEPGPLRHIPGVRTLGRFYMRWAGERLIDADARIREWELDAH